MQIAAARNFSLEMFEGPLELLLYLIKKNELDIYEIPIQSLTEQFLKSVDTSSVDEGAEFVFSTATLLHLKSRSLLPKEEQESQEEADFRVELLEKLVEYAKFRDLAGNLKEKERLAQLTFARPKQDIELPVRPFAEALEVVSLDDLAAAFERLLKNAKTPRPANIEFDKYSVADVIDSIRTRLLNKEPVRFIDLFSEDTSRMYWITAFLALLEMMKTEQITLCGTVCDEWTLELRS